MHIVKQVLCRVVVVAAMKKQIKKMHVGLDNAGLPPGSLQMNDYLMQGTLPVAKVIMLILSDCQRYCLFLHLRKDKGQTQGKTVLHEYLLAV